MKLQPLVLSITTCLFSVSAFAQANISPAEDRKIDRVTGDEIGVGGRDGITLSGADVIVTRNGSSQRLERELTLEDGTRIGVDGSIQFKDGRTSTLGAEQTLTFSGKVIDTPRTNAVRQMGATSGAAQTGVSGAGTAGSATASSPVPTTVNRSATITNQTGAANPGVFFDGSGSGGGTVAVPNVPGTNTTVTTDPQTGQPIYTAPNTTTGQQVTSSTDPRTGLSVTTTTDPRTGARITQSQDPTTGLPVTTTTDPQTGRTTSTTTDPRTGQIVPAQRNPQTGQSPVPPSAQTPVNNQFGGQTQPGRTGTQQTQQGGTLPSGGASQLNTATQPGATTGTGMNRPGTTTNGTTPAGVPTGSNATNGTGANGTNAQGNNTPRSTTNRSGTGGTTRTTGGSAGNSGAGSGTSGGSSAGTTGQSGGGSSR